MNFQNIPRGDKVVKAAFIPKRGAFSFFDYKQIEPRLLAYFAAQIGDTKLADAIKSGLDPYTAIVRGIYGDNPTDEERQEGKILFLSLMYGGGVKTVMEQFGVNAATAKTMIKTFHEAWPVVRRLQDMVQRVHGKRGFIRGLDGRHLHMEEYGEHKLLNKLIQGSAAGVMKQALLRVDDWIQGDGSLESRMVSVIHDEIVFDGPTYELHALHKNVPLLMIDKTVDAVVPIGVDHEVSTTTWADKVGYEEYLLAA